jgi:ribose transport system ATP-binding protein
VLRDGRNAGQLSRAQIDHQRMVQLMVGRDVSQFYRRRPGHAGTVLLEADGLATFTHPQHRLSFALRQREIVGLAGLVGAGRTELLRTLAGIEPPWAGIIRVAGRPRWFRGPADAIEAGLALVPDDRIRLGLIVEASLRENIGLAGLRRHRRLGGLVNDRQQRRDARAMIDALRIRPPDDRQIVRYLSGGNQQKVVLGKWLALKPQVLLLDEPTRGVDVGAKQEIYRQMERLADAGMAILFASNDMEEIVGLSDRVLVMHEGRLAGELTASVVDERQIMRLATGAER